MTAGAESLGIKRQTIQNQIQRLKEKAAREGYTPGRFCHEGVEPGFTTKRISTHTNAAGEQSGWHIQEPSKVEQQQMLRDFVQGLCDDIAPVDPVPLAQNKQHDPELMAGIFMGDAHFGMYSYGLETKHSDFDTDIAARQTREAIDYLVSVAPDAKTGLFVDVGDAQHADSSHGQTYKGTDVDVDTRYYRVTYKLAQAMRYAVTRMLKKFQDVIVVIARGNHNEDSATAMQIIVSVIFENEPRVKVLPTRGYFHHIEFGQWLIGVHHGDKVKAPQLVSIMARDLPQAWGRTTHRMWAVGHIHHQQTLEVNGCKVRTFGTLAPPDGWHSSQGYGSEQAMEMLVFRKAGGLHSTYIYNITKPVFEPDAVVT